MSETLRSAANYAAETLKAAGITSGGDDQAPKPTANSNADAGLESSAYNDASTTSLERERDISREEGVPAPAVQSRNEAHWDPEATGNPEVIHEKQDMERELLQKVPERAPAAEDGGSLGSNTGSVGGAITSGGASESEGSGIFTTEDGRQTYAPDGHNARDSTREAPDAYAGGEVPTHLGHGNSDASAGATALGPGIGLSSASRDAFGSGNGEASGFEDGDSSNRGTQTSSTTGYDDTRLGEPDSTAVAKDTSIGASASQSADPTTGSSGDIAAETPESQRNENGVGGQGEGQGEGSDDKKPKGTHRENPSAIPFAGDKRVGENHWGESSMLRE